MSESEREFAFGLDYVKGVECPIRASDIDIPTTTAGVVEYDRQLSQNSTRQGIVSEEKAKEAWLNAIEEAMTSNYPPGTDMPLRDVARDLGWLEDDE